MVRLRPLAATALALGVTACGGNQTRIYTGEELANLLVTEPGRTTPQKTEAR